MWFLLLLIPLVFALDFNAVPWKITYAKYRLWYEVNLAENASQAWIYFEIPDSILNDVMKYCQDHNYTYCELAFPRVYYYNLTSGEQIQIPCRWEGTTSSVGVPYCIVHSYKNFTVYMENLPAGTHYFVVYFPYYFWEDFEDLPLGASINGVGRCFSDGWCVVADYDYYNSYTYATIVSSGWEPTPQKRLLLRSYTDSRVYYITIKRGVNLTVNPNYPLILEFDNNGAGAIYFEFRLKDGNTVTLEYDLGGYNNNAGVSNICNTISVPDGHVKRDLLKDLAEYCGIMPYQVITLTAIYINSAGKNNLYIDNLKIIPGDIVNYFP